MHISGQVIALLANDIRPGQLGNLETW